MLRRPIHDQAPGDWFALAADRLRIADLAWEREGLTAAGIELLQQAAERYLKGFLVARGWKLVKTHDLGKLISAATKYESYFAAFNAWAEELNADFFAQHYPSGDLTNVGSNYEVLRQQTGEMIALIQQLLPQYFPTST